MFSLQSSITWEQETLRSCHWFFICNDKNSWRKLQSKF